MAFKGDKPEDLLNYYYDYSHAVDNTSIVSMDREEYVTLNMLLEVGPTRQRKILEKSTKPTLVDILDNINSKITVNNISSGLKQKDKKDRDKVMRVEGGDVVCFKCNKTGQYKNECIEKDEKEFHCTFYNSFGHERYNCKIYNEEPKDEKSLT